MNVSDIEKGFFKKIAEKIKAIVHTFIAKISGVFMDDKKLLTKYKSEVIDKNLDDLEVKWVTYTDPTAALSKIEEPDVEGAKWVEDKDDRVKIFLGYDPKKFTEEMNKAYTGSAEAKPKEVKLSSVGGISAVCSYLEGYQKNLKALTKRTDDIINMANAASAMAKKMQQDAEKYVKMDSEDKDEQENLKTARHSYDMAQAFNEAVMKTTNWVLNADKTEYKQNKAAFMKAISYKSSKKGNTISTEEAYLAAVAEAAEQEVDDAIDNALSKECFDDINKASLNIKDTDVSDDPDKLTYGPDQYTDNLYGTTSGTVDTEINSKEESAFFGRLFY